MTAEAEPASTVMLDEAARGRIVHELWLSQVVQNARLADRANRWMSPDRRGLLRIVGLALCGMGLMLTVMVGVQRCARPEELALVMAATLAFLVIGVLLWREPVWRPAVRRRAARFAARRLAAAGQKHAKTLLELQPDCIRYWLSGTQLRSQWTRAGTTVRESSLSFAGLRFGHVGHDLIALYAVERALSPKVLILTADSLLRDALTAQGVLIEPLPTEAPAGYELTASAPSTRSGPVRAG